MARVRRHVPRGRSYNSSYQVAQSGRRRADAGMRSGNRGRLGYPRDYCYPRISLCATTGAGGRAMGRTEGGHSTSSFVILVLFRRGGRDGQRSCNGDGRLDSSGDGERVDRTERMRRRRWGVHEHVVDRRLGNGGRSCGGGRHIIRNRLCCFGGISTVALLWKRTVAVTRLGALFPRRLTASAAPWPC